MIRRSSALVGCLVVLFLTACASTPSAPPPGDTQPPPPSGSEAPVPPSSEPPRTPATAMQVSGVVTYRERIALTPEAVVQVEVVEMMPDATQGPIVGEQTLRSPGQVPIAFSVSIAPERFRPEASYIVRARITDGGRVFSTPAPVPVLTHASPSSDVQVLVRPGG